MVFTVVGEAQGGVWLAAPQATPLSVESSIGLIPVLINLHWHVIELSHGLNLQVVAPDFVAAVLSHIVADAFVALQVDERQEIEAVQVDVVHTLLPNDLVVTHIAIGLK